MNRSTLQYLTQDDRRAILAKARRASFGPGEVILEEGSRKQALFILQDGIARVERAYASARGMLN